MSGQLSSSRRCQGIWDARTRPYRQGIGPGSIQGIVKSTYASPRHASIRAWKETLCQSPACMPPGSALDVWWIRGKQHLRYSGQDEERFKVAGHRAAEACRPSPCSRSQTWAGKTRGSPGRPLSPLSRSAPQKGRCPLPIARRCRSRGAAGQAASHKTEASRSRGGPKKRTAEDAAELVSDEDASPGYSPGSSNYVEDQDGLDTGTALVAPRRELAEAVALQKKRQKRKSGNHSDLYDLAMVSRGNNTSKTLSVQLVQRALEMTQNQKDKRKKKERHKKSGTSNGGEQCGGTSSNPRHSATCKAVAKVQGYPTSSWGTPNYRGNKGGKGKDDWGLSTFTTRSTRRAEGKRQRQEGKDQVGRLGESAEKGLGERQGEARGEAERLFLRRRPLLRSLPQRRSTRSCSFVAHWKAGCALLWVLLHVSRTSAELRNS